MAIIVTVVVFVLIVIIETGCAYVDRFPEQCSLALSVQHMLWVETNVIVYCKSDGSSTAVCSALLDSGNEEVTCRYLDISC